MAYKIGKSRMTKMRAGFFLFNFYQRLAILPRIFFINFYFFRSIFRASLSCFFLDFEEIYKINSLVGDGRKQRILLIGREKNRKFQQTTVVKKI